MQRLLSRLFHRVLYFVGNSSAFEVYTDGSSKNGFGSWAYVISQRGKCINENSSRVRRGNSNVMEFQAAIEALSSLSVKSRVSLFSDSRILIDAMTLREEPPPYRAQIDILKRLNRKHQIEWRWIKAHNGNEFNERCDELCILARSHPARSASELKIN